MRSNRTIEEFEAAAMLLGWDYDRHDHTFMKQNYEPLKETYIDADTLEQCYFGTGNDFVDEWNARQDRVRMGEIGASDYAPKL